MSHRQSPFRNLSLLLILLIGTVLPISSQGQGGDQRDGKLVLVEPMGLYTYAPDGSVANLKPYRERRDKWGATFGISYSSYEPTNYQPDFITVPMDMVYGSADIPLIELEFCFKWNAAFGSIGLEAGGGYYKNKSYEYSDASVSQLTLYPIRLGIRVSLEALTSEVYLVPYGTVGVYSVFFDEDLPPVNYSGNTQAAPYWAAGALFNIDWMDRPSAIEAYEDSGIQGTFLFAEARQFITSQAASDPDLGSDIHFDAGFKMEF